jgi:NodT family efflux transporter outer membrane factor (OMF) lipoprotein
LQLTEDRLRAQIAPALDVRQAELNLARTESIIPTLRTLEALAIHRLGVLLGEYPSELYDELSAEAPIPAPPETIDISLPANLVRQRPDIRQAERQLAAQTARIGVATADLYPRFSLSGAFAFQATDFGNTFDRSSITYLVGPSVRWNLFNGGRVRNSIIAEDARTKQALARYEESVLLALEEVANALVAYVQESERRDALARSVTAAEQSVELVKTLYRTGLTDFQNVLSMDRSLFVQQDEFAESKGRVTKSLVRVYKALGGGWDPGPRVIRDEIVDAAEKGEPRI